MLRRNFLSARLAAIGGMFWGWIISHEKSISPHYLDKNGYSTYWVKGRLITNNFAIPLPIEKEHPGFVESKSYYYVHPIEIVDNQEIYKVDYEIHYEELFKFPPPHLKA